MRTLTHIGYWRSDLHPELPDPNDFVDLDWNEDDRSAVSSYLTSGTIVRAYMGYSPCRICGNQNGNLEFSDGRFLWPEGLVHYIDDHGIRLPAPIVEHAIAAIDDLEGANVDDAWWLSVTSGFGS